MQIPYRKLSVSDSAYPEKLRQLFDAPNMIYIKGDEGLLNRQPIVGIVGARKFTAYGKIVTEQIANLLVHECITIVSGLALGIDSIAHRAAVESATPTIAVLPCGIETVYPARHRRLADQIVGAGGSLISEYVGRSLPRNDQFIARNRIIAALSDVLIIPEAAERSGSLHTARFALELGRTIMVVPGNITSAYSTGTNRLIKSGAVPIIDPADVLRELGIFKKDAIQEYLPENDIESQILTAIHTGTVETNELLQLTGLEPGIFQAHLTILEIKGVVEAQAGRWQLRV